MAQDTNVNRDEEILPDLSSLLLLKILDEQAHRLRPDEALEFRRQEGKREETAKHVKTMLQREARKHAGIFGHSNVHLAIDDESIGYAVEQLQSYRLLGNDANAISTAFQVLRGRAYKGEEGQYFIAAVRGEHRRRGGRAGARGSDHRPGLWERGASSPRHSTPYRSGWNRLPAKDRRNTP